MIHTPPVIRLLSALLVFLAIITPTMAQITPERLYYGVGQRVIVNIEVPEGFFGEITVRVYDPIAQEWTHEAPAASGRVDLTSLLPYLWETKPQTVSYAQLELDGTPTGAPLVLQPLVTPNRAKLVDATTMALSEDPRGAVVFEDKRLPALQGQGKSESGLRQVTFSGLRVYVDQEVVMKTSAGDIVFRMRPDAAPNTAYNFLHLSDGGFYTNIIFHRIVAALPNGNPFVIQVGDLSGTGSGGPGYMIDLEDSSLPHDFGVLSMARDSDPDTNGSQVFVALSREGTAFLDGRYTAFAEAVQGAQVIREIAATPVGAEDRPMDPPMLLSCTTRDAPPIQDRLPALSTLEQSPAEQQPDPNEPDR
ncbi:cyp9 [Symbiodinium sp. CCMP2592]|nr:cyp9 [Symbiodinium sp. CCMP2592]